MRREEDRREEGGREEGEGGRGRCMDMYLAFLPSDNMTSHTYTLSPVPIVVESCR